MKNNIFLSVVIPMYNSAAYLEHTLHSVVNMVSGYETKTEIILIDDGSTDDTVKIAQTFINRYRYFKLEKLQHQGVSNARNFGIKVACGKYITFVDSDDTYKDGFVNILFSKVGDKPDIIITDINELKCDQSFTQITTSQKIQVIKIINQKIGREGINSKIYKLDFLRNNNLSFSDELYIGEDALFLYRAITLSKSILLTNTDFYFIGKSHTLAVFHANLKENEIKFLKKLHQILKKYNGVSNYSLIRQVEDRYIRKSYFRLIRQYYVPLYLQKKMSLRVAKKQLQEIAKEWGLKFVLDNDTFDSLLSKRQRVQKVLLRYKLYGLSILWGVFIKKVKNG